MTSDHPGALQPDGGAGRLAPHLINALLIGAMFAYALITFGDLPARYAIHFTASGTPDGWTDKSLGGWLAMPLVALGMTVLMVLASKLVDVAKTHPGLMSIPHKKKFLALPAAAQAPIWRQMKGLLYWTAAPINLLLFYAQWSIHRAATSPQGGMTLWPMFALLGLSGLQVIYQTVSLTRAVKRAVGQL